MKPIFITGIGTGVGKTLISSIVTEALGAAYWKPVQAGEEEGTDTQSVASLVSNPEALFHPETYRLRTPASPHIAARLDGVTIDENRLAAQARNFRDLHPGKPLVIEGAGGLLVPLRDDLNVAGLASALDAKLILVSRNYLGSINHSLLTAAYCKAAGMDVAGWIFNDRYMDYEEEVVRWSGIRSLGSVPRMKDITKESVREQAAAMRASLLTLINND